MDLMNKEIFTETERLIVYKPDEQDFQYLVTLCQNEQVMRFFGGVRSAPRIKELMHLFMDNYNRDGFGYGLVFDKLNNDFVGRVGFNRLELNPDTDKIEFGILLLPQYWNKKFATELATKYKELGFNQFKFKQIYYVIDPENIYSEKCFLKIGATFKEKISYQGKELNLYVCVNEKDISR